MTGVQVIANKNMEKLLEEAAVPEARYWGPIASFGWGGRYAYVVRTPAEKAMVMMPGFKRPWKGPKPETMFIDGTKYDWDSGVRALRAALTPGAPTPPTLAQAG